jgi:hypothetical protein
VRALVLGSALVLEAVATLTLLRPSGIAHAALWFVIVSTPLAVTAVLQLRRLTLSSRTCAGLVLGVTAALQIFAMVHSPQTSDDDNRYIWDAKVQLSGVDPYRYAPQAPELSSLRDHFLFPGGSCPHPVPGSCTTINRPSVHTVYPPVAEGAFVAIRLASAGGAGGHLPLQIAAGLGVLAVTFVLVRVAVARGRPVWTAAVWGWSPLVVLEYGNGAHIDWLAVLLMIGAVVCVRSGRALLGGALAGAAVVTKLYPLVLLPALLRRRPVATLGAAAGVVVLSYVPHVAAVGGRVIGYLPGYLKEEQYTSGGRLLLLGAVLPHPVDTVAGVLVMLSVGWLVWRRGDRYPTADAAVFMMGAALLVATPAYGWYAGGLLALVALAGALEWLPLAIAPTVLYLLRLDVSHSTATARAVYAVAALLVALGHVARRYQRRRVVTVAPRTPDRDRAFA